MDFLTFCKGSPLGFPWLFIDFRWISMDFPTFCKGSPWGFPWIFFDFLRISKDFDGFRWVGLCRPALPLRILLLRASMCMHSLCFPYAFPPLLFLCFPYAFPTHCIRCAVGALTFSAGYPFLTWVWNGYLCSKPLPDQVRHVTMLMYCFTCQEEVTFCKRCPWGFHRNSLHFARGAP